MSQGEQAVSVPAGFRGVRRRDEFWEKVAQGIWEPATVRVLGTVLTAASTHIDVGAWIGPTVLLTATRADHVLAFEPDPVAYAELDRNVALNPDLAGRVDLRQEALFDRGSVMRMASNSDHLGDSGTSLVHRDVTCRETVNVRTLDARQVAAEQPAFAALRERWMVLTRVRDIDVLTSPRSIPEFGGRTRI